MLSGFIKNNLLAGSIPASPIERRMKIAMVVLIVLLVILLSALFVLALKELRFDRRIRTLENAIADAENALAEIIVERITNRIRFYQKTVLEPEADQLALEILMAEDECR